MADKTKTIMFTVATVYRTLTPVTYEQGQVVELREDLADRWISRGVATDDADLIAKAKRGAEPTPDPESLPEGVPVNWRSLNSADMRDLAVKLGAASLDIQNRAQAFSYVSAKVAEHKQPAAS